MRETKLKRWILGIYIGMVVLLVAMVLVWKLRFYDKVNTDISTTQLASDEAEKKAKTLDDQLFAAAKANANLALARSEVDYFRKRFRNLNFDLTSPGTTNATWIRYLNEYFSDYGLETRRQLVAAADQTGVVIASKVAVQAPPQMPEQVASPPSGYLKPLSTGSMEVTVTGPLPNILRFFERINRSEILMTVGNVKLEGTSPTIKATTTITPYLLASGPSALLAVPPAATTTTTEGGAAANPDGTPTAATTTTP